MSVFKSLVAICMFFGDISKFFVHLFVCSFTYFHNAEVNPSAPHRKML